MTRLYANRANQISSVFITSAVDHITGYDGSLTGGLAVCATIELVTSVGGSPVGCGIWVVAKTPGTAYNGWDFVIDQNNVSPVTVVLTVDSYAITGDGGVTTFANILAALQASTDVTDLWEIYTDSTYNGASVLPPEGTDGEGPQTATTDGGVDFTAECFYRKANGIWHDFDGIIVGTSGAAIPIPGSFRVLWNADHLDQVGDLEIMIPAIADERDPTNKVFEVAALPDGVLWEGGMTFGGSGTDMILDITIDDVVPTAGDDNTLAKARIFIVSGTGAGQTWLIDTYVASTRKATVFAGGVAVLPDATTRVCVIPGGVVDVGAWGGIYWDTARPEVDVAKYKGALAPSLVSSRYPADVGSISGDATAADNLEATFDGTGYVDDTAPATQAQVSHIAVTGAALNTTAASRAITTGSGSGGVANTKGVDGTTDNVADVALALDFYYEFDISTISGAVGVGVQWTGYLDSVLATVAVYAYDWVGTAWTQIGSVDSGSVNEVQEFELSTAHTAAGLVRFRFAGANAASFTVKTDRLLLGYAVTAPSVAAIASGILDADEADYDNPNSIGLAIQSGSAPTVVEIVDGIKAMSHDTGVTFDGLCKRLEAAIAGGALNMKGLGDGTVVYYLRDGVTIAFTGVLDPALGNRSTSDVSGSEP